MNTVIATKSKNQVILSKNEYIRLKNLDQRFGQLLSYFVYCADIADARQEIKDKKVIPQEELFRAVGL